MLTRLKFSMEDLVLLLGSRSSTISHMEKRGTLKKNLEAKGYEWVSKIREGRKVYYILNREDTSQDAILLTNIIQNCYKTTNYVPFSAFYTIRYVFAKANWEGATVKKIAEYVGVHENTILKWDKLLKESGVLSQDGYYYYKLDLSTYEEVSISHWEYKSYWNNRRDISAINKLQTRYDNGEITFNELRIALSELEETHKAVEGKYCFRVKRYIINEMNILSKDIWKLIKKCYLTDIGLDYVSLRNKR